LFDFDIEVKPILEVLVGKTVEQALMEVMEEEELASLRAQQVYMQVQYTWVLTCVYFHSVNLRKTEMLS